MLLVVIKMEKILKLMKAALKEKQMVKNIMRGFKLYLQFIVDAKTKKIASAEALSRWESKKQGLISPGNYIAIMERVGLISKHDFNMFEMVCHQLEKWNTTKFNNVMISCNFTRITLSEKDFVEKIKEISDKYTFDRSMLCIEIIEDTIEKDINHAFFNMKECKNLGFTVALDDLGSGYTTLANICDYPVDIVKIDREILLKAVDERGKALFKGAVELAHKLNLKVVSEGVETEEQNQFVIDADCDYIQGFYYHRPIPREEAEKILL